MNGKNFPVLILSHFKLLPQKDDFTGCYCVTPYPILIAQSLNSTNSILYASFFKTTVF